MAIYFLFWVSCAYFSAHGRAYKKAQSVNKRGDYEQAVYASVDALRIKPDYEEVEKIMDEAFPKAIRKHHKKIEWLKSHQKDFYWDKIINELKKYKIEFLKVPLYRYRIHSKNRTKNKKNLKKYDSLLNKND